MTEKKSRKRSVTRVSPSEGYEIDTEKHSYILISKLGGGGMAEVWKAKHMQESKVQGKDVFYALKLVHREICEKSSLYGRLKDEAKIAQSLRHPNIVPTHGLLTGLCGNPFITMNYLDGRDFSDLLYENGFKTGLSVEKVIALMTPVAEALDYAHTKLTGKEIIVHRDIKPENLFQTYSGEVYVLDFGISEKLHSTGSQLGIGDEDIYDGTKPYWGPEVCRRTRLSPSRDVYAFSVVVFELLTDEKPYPLEVICDRPHDMYPSKPRKLDNNAWAILKRGLMFDWRERPHKILTFWNEFVKAWEQENYLHSLPSINNIPSPNIKMRQLRIASALNMDIAFNDLANRKTPEMIVIPGGKFKPSDFKRSDDDSSFLPLTEEKDISHFCLGKFPVSVFEFKEFLKDSKHEYSLNESLKEQNPITNINWNDALAYIRWLSNKTGKMYRLPTEYEWEYSCRAGTVTKYFYGSEINSSQAQFFDLTKKKSHRYLQAVGTYKPNTFGLYDMHGTVWEWAYKEPKISYNATVEKQVIRGGAWDVGKEKLHSSFRMEYSFDDKFPNVGFRVARDI